MPHRKRVLSCCAQCPWMDLPITESDQKNSNVIPTIQFHDCEHKVRCTVYEIRHFNEKKQCQFCETSTDLIITTKI